MGSRGVTGTVSDDETVNAREVEHHEVVKGGGVGTHVANVVSKLENEAKGREGGAFKEAAIPFLRVRQFDKSSQQMLKSYLNPVERGRRVACKQAALADRFSGRTAQATILRSRLARAIAPNGRFTRKAGRATM